ncbi:MAG: 2-hydroxychromene-2-carboxylate isomerase [Devosia sp.]
MVEQIDAFYGISSPWAYLGTLRLYDLADRTQTRLVLKPIRVVTENGGVPLRSRPEPRQTYHATELARWSDYLGIPLNLEPRHYPCRTIEIAACSVIAMQQAGYEVRDYSYAVQRALWAEDRDIADVDTLRTIALQTLDAQAAALITEPPLAAAETQWRENLAEAETLGIFGTPTYVFNKQLFWGQDRLDFLERAIVAHQTNLTSA